MSSELEAIQMIQALEAAMPKVGAQAFRVYQRTLSRAIRPLLLRQQQVLQEYAETLEAKALMEGLDEVEIGTRPEVIVLGAKTDEQVKQLDAQATEAWKVCVQEIRGLAAAYGC